MFWSVILRYITRLHCMRTTSLMFFIFLFSVCCGSGAWAGEMREHGAHVHGIGQLNVVLSGDELVLELESPGVNIVGFEHTPENEQQSHIVQEAVGLLENGKKMFVLTADAQCSLHKAHIESELVEDSHKKEKEKEKADHHEHDGNSDHSEFEGTYHFKCVHPDKLKTIDVRLFSFFPGLKELEVQLIAPTKKTAVELTPEEFQLILQ